MEKKIAIQVQGAPSFFAEVTEQAARLDRSPSWLLGQCLRVSLASLASPDKAPSAIPTGSAARTFFVPKDVAERFDGLGKRYGLSRDALYAWAWQTTRDAVRRMPSS